MTEIPGKLRRLSIEVFCGDKRRYRLMVVRRTTDSRHSFFRSKTARRRIALSHFLEFHVSSLKSTYLRTFLIAERVLMCHTYSRQFSEVHNTIGATFLCSIAIS